MEKKISISIPESFREQHLFFPKHTGRHIVCLLTRFNVNIDGVCRKVGANCMKSFGNANFWSFRPFWCQFETFSFRTLQLSVHKRLLDNQPFPCWLFETFQSTKSVETSTKLQKRLWKLENFGFVILGVTLRHFHLKNCNKLFGKDYWTTNCFLVDPLKHSKPRCLSKIWQKCVKTMKNGRLWDFCHFPCQFEIFFSIGKKQLSHRKSLLDNKLVPCWAISTF